MMKLSLYSYFRSSCTYRIRIVLQLKKINYEYKTVDLLKLLRDSKEGAELLTDVKSKNPIGQLPILEVEKDNKKHLLVQSLPIIEFLEESYPGTYSIFPEDPILRQKTRAMAELINSSIQPLQNIRLLDEMGKKGIDKKEWATSVIDKGFIALEKMIEEVGGQFCVGDKVTLVDCCLIPQINNAKIFGMDITKYSRLNAIYERCMKLDEFIKASPPKQPDYPGDNFVKY